MIFCGIPALTLLLVNPCSPYFLSIRENKKYTPDKKRTARPKDNVLENHIVSMINPKNDKKKETSKMNIERKESPLNLGLLSIPLCIL